MFCVSHVYLDSLQQKTQYASSLFHCCCCGIYCCFSVSLMLLCVTDASLCHFCCLSVSLLLLSCITAASLCHFCCVSVSLLLRSSVTAAVSVSSDISMCGGNVTFSPAGSTGCVICIYFPLVLDLLSMSHFWGKTVCKM